MPEPVVEAGMAAGLGLVAGSWAGLVVHRLPRGLPTVRTRSRCPACGTALGPRDLVPLVSWLATRGRCRHCGAAIGPREPAIEIAAAVIAVAAWAAAPGPGAAVRLGLLGLVLLIAAAIDLDHFRLPDATTGAAAALAVPWYGLLATDPIAPGPIDAAATAAAGAALAAGLALAVRFAFARLARVDALGLGDVKLLAAAGLWLGPDGVPALLVAGGAAGVATGLAWRTAGRGRVFPFGPGLALAFFALACLQAAGA
ncbi:MAG: prepilin peptidase [Azospirillaceae bacterium]